MRRCLLLLPALLAWTLIPGCRSPQTHRSFSPWYRSNAYGSAVRALAANDRAVLVPGQEVARNIENAPQQVGVVPSGQSPIGPDGTIMVGPYGTCRVAGLTQEQAGRALAEYLKDHVPQPRVKVQLLT